MIWLTWRQYRFELLITAMMLGLVGAGLGVTGLTIEARYQDTGLADCLAASGFTNCSDLRSSFLRSVDSLSSLLLWLNFVPCIIGILLAAPLALEFEQGTYRLAWTQSVSRERWLAWRLVFAVGAATLAAGILAVLLVWWRAPIDRIEGRMTDAFSLEGPVFVSYSLFSLALGLCLGTFLRRTVPAMSISVLVFVGLRLGVQYFLRPHYLSPLVRVEEASDLPTPVSAGAWMLQAGFIDKAGNALTPHEMFALCGPATAIVRPDDSTPPALDTLSACIQQHGILSEIVYQPASRFWLFQGIESAIFLAGTMALIGVTVWLVSKRLAR